MFIFSKILPCILFFKILFINSSFSEENKVDFETWLQSYKNYALEKGISQKTIDIAFQNVISIPLTWYVVADSLSEGSSTKLVG